MKLEDIKLVIKHEIETEEECTDEITVCTVFMVNKKNINQTHNVLGEIEMAEKSGISDKYCICLESNYENRTNYFDNMPYDFCEYIYILNKEDEIGGACLNRIFVEDIEGIAVWIDNEAPNSMEIATHICKKDFKVVEGRFIGIIDEFTLNEEFIKSGVVDLTIFMLYSLIREWGFNIYYLYTQPNDNLEVYEELGFEIVDTGRSILRKDLWHETVRDKMDSKLEPVYLP